jgi:hypothetical protein
VKKSWCILSLLLALVVSRMNRIIQGSGNLLTIDASVLEAGVYFYSVYKKEKA